MKVELKKHYRDGLKWAVFQFLVSKDRRWKRETANGLLTVMFVFKDIGLIDEAEWKLWRWVLDAAEADDSHRTVPTKCPSCDNKEIQFRCDKCRRALVYHPNCLPELVTDAQVVQQGDHAGELFCNQCLRL